MDARLTTEQRDLAEAADRLARRLGVATVGDLDDDERRQRLDAALEQAGWRELRTGSPTGPLAGGAECAFVARALARSAADAAYLGPVLAADLARRAGVDGLAKRTTIAMNPALTGLAEIGQGWSAVPVAVDAAASDAALVLTAAGDRWQPGTMALGQRARGVDLSRPVAMAGEGSVEPVGRPVSADDLVAWSALGIALTVADLVGAMEGALELTTEYAKQRRQYGAAIGSYQAVQHLLAEAATLVEGSVSVMMYAAWAVDALEPVAARQAAAMAKAYASRAARTVSETAIQVHGGIGNTWECMAHVFLRRIVLATELFGGEGRQLALLATERLGATSGLS